MSEYTELFVKGIPLLAVIFGLVEFGKACGLTGRMLSIISMLLGMLLGIAYKVAESGLPAGFGGWFAVVIFGLFLGLVTSGFYDFANQRWPKVGK